MPVTSKAMYRKFRSELGRRISGRRPSMPGISVSKLHEFLHGVDYQGLPARARKRGKRG